MTEDEAIRAPGAHIHVAREQRHARRLRNPPTLEQFWFAPRFEDDVRRGIERSRHDEFAVGLAFHGGAVHGGGTTFFSFGHLPSPLILSARQSCPARRSVRSRVGGAARSRRPLLPARAWQACRF